jgi:hypothetical protein
MNPGAESVIENDKTPLYLCPLCEDKLRLALPHIDRVKRYVELQVFYEKFDLKEASSQAAKCLQFLNNPAVHKREIELNGQSEEQQEPPRKKQRIIVNND